MRAAQPDRRRRLGPVPCLRAPNSSDERGISLVELVVAMAVLGIIMSGLALSLSVDFKSVALVRSRQVAEAAANRRLEEFRDVDYAALALLSQPVPSSDSTNPNSFVSKDGLRYDVTGTGQNEDLIVAVGTGPVVQIEPAFTIGATVLDIYRYVTWVDIASVPGTHDVKRLSVVVRYHTAPGGGTARMLRESVLLTPGTVSTGASTVTTTTTTTTTLPPTTTTTLAGTTCGSFTLSAASPATAGFSATTTVTITTSLAGCGTSVLMNFSNNGGGTWGSDFAYSSSAKTTSWTLSTGDGVKTVSARLRNGAAGVPKLLASQNITLDTIAPTAPNPLTYAASCSGSNRTVVLAWTTAFDTNLVGYRVYRSTDGVTYSLLSSTTTRTASNTHSKTLASVSFYVTAYDSAGNTSNATNTIILGQNQCS